MTGTELLYGRVDTWARTNSALNAAGRFNPDTVLVTGDIADCYNDVYADAARLFERVEEQLGCPVIVLPGNHDRSEQSIHFNRRRMSSGPESGDTTHLIDGLRVIALESDQPGSPSGRLTGKQLRWLERELSVPADHGTLLAMHHPPITSVFPQLAGRGLASPADLQRAITGTDVRAIVCGHYHHAASGWLGTIPVWVSPAVSYNHNLSADANSGGMTDSSWLSVIELTPSAFNTTPLPVAGGYSVSTVEPGTATSIPLDPIDRDLPHPEQPHRLQPKGELHASSR